jgi:F0F1-type ATP synthase membrane subunit c/vacuolar-type H+-ATPase subunit K
MGISPARADCSRETGMRDKNSGSSILSRLMRDPSLQSYVLVLLLALAALLVGLALLAPDMSLGSER